MQAQEKKKLSKNSAELCCPGSSKKKKKNPKIPLLKEEKAWAHLIWQSC